MSTPAKIGLVRGGYVIACLAAAGVIYVYQLFTQDAAAQASSGMYATRFGGLLLFIGICGILALFPTGLALYFLFTRSRA